MIVFSPADHSQATSLDLGSLSASRSSRVRNLGVHLDESLKLDKHISSVIGSSFYQLRLLSKIKHFLNATTLEIVVHAFITSRLDYCNSLYCGISKSQITLLLDFQDHQTLLLDLFKLVANVTTSPLYRGPFTGCLFNLESILKLSYWCTTLYITMPLAIFQSCCIFILPLEV